MSTTPGTILKKITCMYTFVKGFDGKNLKTTTCIVSSMHHRGTGQHLRKARSSFFWFFPPGGKILEIRSDFCCSVGLGRGVCKYKLVGIEEGNLPSIKAPPPLRKLGMHGQ